MQNASNACRHSKWHSNDDGLRIICAALGEAGADCQHQDRTAQQDANPMTRRETTFIAVWAVFIIGLAVSGIVRLVW